MCKCPLCMSAQWWSGVVNRTHPALQQVILLEPRAVGYEASYIFESPGDFLCLPSFLPSLFCFLIFFYIIEYLLSTLPHRASNLTGLGWVPLIRIFEECLEDLDMLRTLDPKN